MFMQTLPGFRDFLPEDCAKRNYIFSRWREVARRYGFMEWEGPPLEATELYRKKSGTEIVDQLFNFTDKGEREVAMRPELTPTLARVVAAHEREFKKPLKWFSIGQFFRYEKQQRGRLREHFQLNCYISVENDLAASIELVALCIDVLRAFGFTEKDFVVRISDREFWTDLFRENNVPAERWDELLQVIDKSGREPREKTAEKLGHLADPVFAILKSGGQSEKLDKLVDGLCRRGLADFVQIDVGIVRGLAYYTGIVFELFDRAGKFRAIAGGGRYDNLIAQLSDGAVSLPALGFAMGDVVLSELINEIPRAREAMQKAVASDRKIDIGGQVQLAGWVNVTRDHGEVIFIDLRDREGLTQVVFRPEENAELAREAHTLRSEDVIQVSGRVAARVPGTENPNLATGDVEPIPSKLRILNRP